MPQISPQQKAMNSLHDVAKRAIVVINSVINESRLCGDTSPFVEKYAETLEQLIKDLECACNDADAEKEAQSRQILEWRELALQYRALWITHSFAPVALATKTETP